MAVQTYAADGILARHIRDGVARVRDRMELACRRAGRSSDSVRLIAVAKSFSAEYIRSAFEAGLCDFGENKVQEAAAKQAALSDLAITWHLIGHLQTNKAGRARNLFQWVHSVDSLRLAEKLDRPTGEKRERLPILLEVNLGGEPSKTGIREDELWEVAHKTYELSNLQVSGLMLVPPFSNDPRDTRPYFRKLHKLSEELRRHCHGITKVELSMGMSHDFEIAIEEGATMIRVGTAIFGMRPPQNAAPLD